MAALKPRHSGSLAPPSRALLSGLAGRAWSADTYLAGSAALALYLAHRPVRGLDLMSSANRLASPQRRDLLADLLAFDPAARVETARDGYLFVRLAGEVELRLFHYPYPLVDPTEEVQGLAVASPVDLGLMKLAAIVSRGTRKDFIDLYELCRELPLGTLFGRSAEKFGHVRDFPLQALKGLADRSLARDEPSPRLAVPLDWAAVEAWLNAEVVRLGRRLTGLGGARGS